MKPRHRLVDQLDHDISNIQRLLDVWHSEIRAPFRGGLEKLITSMHQRMQRARRFRRCPMCFKRVEA